MTGPDAREEADGDPPGAQAERTRLAWERTAVAAAAVGAVVARLGRPPAGPVAGALVILAALALGVLSVARYRSTLRLLERAATLPPRPRLVAGATAAATAVSLACALAIASRV